MALRFDKASKNQLERALQRDREVNAPAQEEKVGGAVQIAADGFDCRAFRENPLQLGRYREQLLNQMQRSSFIQIPARLAQVHGQEEQRGQLCRKGLGRSDTDLRTGMGNDGARRLPRDHGTDHVADGQRRRSLPLRFALRSEGIGRFPRLRNHDGQLNSM